MDTKPKIIYPFQVNKANATHFAFCVELATQMQAEIVMMASTLKGNKIDCIDEKEEETGNAQKDKIYHHLLELKGHYQTFYNGWKNKIPVQITHVIEHQSLEEMIHNYLQKNEVSMAIFSEALADQLMSSNKELEMNNSPIPIVVMPKQLHFPGSVSTSDKKKKQQLFQNILPQLGLYNVTEAFFQHFYKSHSNGIFRKLKNSYLNLVNDKRMLRDLPPFSYNGSSN